MSRESHFEGVGFAGLQAQELQNMLMAAREQQQTTLGLIITAVGDQPVVDSARNATAYAAAIGDQIAELIGICENLKAELLRLMDPAAPAPTDWPPMPVPRCWFCQRAGNDLVERRLRPFGMPGASIYCCPPGIGCQNDAIRHGPPWPQHPSDVVCAHCPPAARRR